MDISVIILTYNEELHIRRCIENVRDFCADVFIVDSFSIDKTKAIAEELGVKVVQNQWEGVHARQFNWALTHLPIKTKWVLRLDADEYLTGELKQEIMLQIENLPDDVVGCVFKLRRVFLGRVIRRGMPPVKLLRLFQHKKAICEQRLMDEHIRLLEGKSVEFEHVFVDENLNNLSWWSQKHVGYAIREAADLLNLEYDFLKESPTHCEQNIQDFTGGMILGQQAAEKRVKKLKYARLPLFWRAFAYFLYRYVFKGGCLEGKEGFLWHFLQGWWYRTLVDANVLDVKRKAKALLKCCTERLSREEINPRKRMSKAIVAVLRDEYGLMI